MSRVAQTWQHGGYFITHNNPDVDAIHSLWQIFKCLSSIYGITIDEFSNRIKLLPANYQASFPDYGVDIGSGESLDHIKESFTPIIINGLVIRNVCASLYLAYNLMNKPDFEIMKDVILDFNTVDNNGFNPNNTKQYSHYNSIWGIAGALQFSKDDIAVLNIIFGIFDAIYNRLQSAHSENIIDISDIEIYNYKSYMIAVPPLNSGRIISQKCFRELFVNVVIFGSVDSNGFGTVGFNCSKAFSSRFNVTSIINSKYIKQSNHLLGKMFVNEHCIGRTDKSPIPDTNAEIIDALRINFIDAIKELIDSDNEIS